MYVFMKSIGVAVDVAVLSLERERLSVLLVKLKRAPFEGRWGLPGGLIGASETVEAAAARELAEKTGRRATWCSSRCAPSRRPSAIPTGAACRSPSWRWCRPSRRA